MNIKKVDFKLPFVFAFVLVGLFSLVVLFFASSLKVSAQNPVEDEIIVNTTGYSVLSPNSFIFGGIYSGNYDKRGFTTYFEFKKNDPDLDIDENREETIKIVRDTGAEEHADFYTSPELSLFSDYYFRAVGYFNDRPDQKFYGRVLNLRTGTSFIGVIPFTAEVDGSGNMAVKDYTPPSCQPTQTLINGVCVDDAVPPPPDCNPATQILVNGVCVNKDSDTNPDINPDVNPPKDDNSGSGSGFFGLVPCGTERDADDKITNPCGFNHILDLINKVVKFIFLDLVIPIAALAFAYAGFELLTSGGETSKREKAKKTFTNVAIGLVIAVAAFLIVQTILSIAGYDQSWNWFGF